MDVAGDSEAVDQAESCPPSDTTNITDPHLGLPGSSASQPGPPDSQKVNDSTEDTPGETLDSAKELTETEDKVGTNEFHASNATREIIEEETDVTSGTQKEIAEASDQDKQLDSDCTDTVKDAEKENPKQTQLEGLTSAEDIRPTNATSDNPDEKHFSGTSKEIIDQDERPSFGTLRSEGAVSTIQSTEEDDEAMDVELSESRADQQDNEKTLEKTENYKENIDGSVALEHCALSDKSQDTDAPSEEIANEQETGNKSRTDEKATEDEETATANQNVAELNIETNKEGTNPGDKKDDQEKESSTEVNEIMEIGGEELCEEQSHTEEVTQKSGQKNNAQELKEAETGTSKDTEKSSKDQNKNEDSDDDVILVSDNSKESGKKLTFATVYKCIRCGHISNSKIELNKHLLQDHKLIIVSKQKFVDCLFCEKKLEMKDFHQHLKDEHKVLLVKSKNQQGPSGSSAAMTQSSKEKNVSSADNLIDLTSDDEGSTSTTANKLQKKHSVTVAKTPTKPKKDSNISSDPAPPPVPTRKSPRIRAPKKYANESEEEFDSAPDETDAFVNDNDDEDYNPSSSSTKQKTPVPNKSSITTISTQGQNVVTSTALPASTAGLLSSTQTTSNATPVIPSSTIPSSGLIQALKDVKPNTTIRFNNQLYNVAENSGIKYLIPLSVPTNTVIHAAPQPTTQLQVPAVPQTQILPTAPTPAPTRFVLSQSSNTFPTAPQGNIVAGAPRQPIILSSSGVNQGQTFFITLPQGVVQVPQPAPTVQGIQTVIPQLPGKQPIIQQNGQLGVNQPNIQVTPSVFQSASQTNPAVHSQQFSSYAPARSVTSGPVVNKTITTANLNTAGHNGNTIRLNAQSTTANPITLQVKDSQKLKVAAPLNIKSDNLHKSGGLFALEVSLDTNTQPGTEPKVEPKTTYYVQEKETIFEEVPKEPEIIPEDEDKLDSERCRGVVAAAIARGHIKLNDLTSLSQKVQFECSKCHACFPQHLLLCLHIKHCSKLPPSLPAEIKIQAPAAVVNQFFNDSWPKGHYICCRFCRARIMSTTSSNEAHFIHLMHLTKHIEPKVEICILPDGKSTKSKNNGCTPKALEWIDYIVPPFTLENPPTSSKTGLLDQFVTTNNIMDILKSSSHKKKKKKKKKKNKNKDKYKDDSDDEPSMSRLSSLRPKGAPYLGSLRPKEAVTSENPSSKNGSAYNLKPRHHLTMMGSLKHVISPNKGGSTLTAFIPIKPKYLNKAKQDTRQNNGRTRSQHVHWRRQSRRFPAVRERDPPTPEVSTPDSSVIQISSDEERNDKDASEEKPEASATQDPDAADEKYALTEDDISDYLKLFGGDTEEEVQINPQTNKTLSSAQVDGVSQDASADLVDYYGNDADSSLGCEPLIMEPEQVVCYFKNCGYNKMRCQFRDCEAEVLKNIRAMLAHIRVHFQILVPLQLLNKCSSQFPRQSIPRPLQLTFSQVEAHFTIADMQEANLHLGEVQQLYSCKWKNCSRSKCYKKNILQHLVKHIFFTLISKDEYQAMSQTMSSFSPNSDDSSTSVKKLRIVAMNKNGEKIALVITIPTSQAHTAETVRAAIQKSLASNRSVKLPPNVLDAVVSKFLASQESKQENLAAGGQNQSEKNGPEQLDDGTFLTESELESVRKKFPFVIEKLNLSAFIPNVPAEVADEVANANNTALNEKSPHGDRIAWKHSTSSFWKLQKMSFPTWKSLKRKYVPKWRTTKRFKRSDVKIIEKHSARDRKACSMKRSPEDADGEIDQPLCKKEKMDALEASDFAALGPKEENQEYAFIEDNVLGPNGKETGDKPDQGQVEGQVEPDQGQVEVITEGSKHEVECSPICKETTGQVEQSENENLHGDEVTIDQTRQSVMESDQSQSVESETQKNQVQSSWVENANGENQTAIDQADDVSQGAEKSPSTQSNKEEDVEMKDGTERKADVPQDVLEIDNRLEEANMAADDGITEEKMEAESPKQDDQNDDGKGGYNVGNETNDNAGEQALVEGDEKLETMMETDDAGSEDKVKADYSVTEDKMEVDSAKEQDEKDESSEQELEGEEVIADVKKTEEKLDAKISVDTSITEEKMEEDSENQKDEDDKGLQEDTKEVEGHVQQLNEGSESDNANQAPTEEGIPEGSAKTAVGELNMPDKDVPSTSNEESTSQSPLKNKGEVIKDDIIPRDQNNPLLVFGFSATQIMKAFQFCKSKKNMRIQVPERGYGVGLFKCKRSNCLFFLEVMNKDDKILILEALTLHLMLHLKTSRRRPLIFSPNPKTESIPTSKFLELLKSSPNDDFRKMTMKDKFHWMPRRKARLAGVGGRKVQRRLKRYLKCRSSGCFFGSVNASRRILVHHLQAHLHHAQAKAVAEEKLLQNQERSTTEAFQATDEDTRTSHPDNSSVSSTPVPSTPCEDEDSTTQTSRSTSVEPSETIETNPEEADACPDDPEAVEKNTGTIADEAEATSDTNHDGNAEKEDNSLEESSAIVGTGQDENGTIPGASALDVPETESASLEDNAGIEKTKSATTETGAVENAVDDPVAAVPLEGGEPVSEHSQVDQAEGESTSPVHRESPSFTGQGTEHEAEGDARKQDAEVASHMDTSQTREKEEDNGDQSAAQPSPKMTSSEASSPKGLSSVVNGVEDDHEQNMDVDTFTDEHKEVGDNVAILENKEQNVLPEIPPEKLKKSSSFSEGESAEQAEEIAENTNEQEIDEMETEDNETLPSAVSDETSVKQSINSDLSEAAPTRDMDELARRPGDSIKMFYDELQSYFSCYTSKISQTKEFGVQYFSCPKCGKRDLRGSNLPKHLELHVGKTISVTSVDNIRADIPEVALEHGIDALSSVKSAIRETVNEQTTATVQGISKDNGSNGKGESGYEETEDTVYISEEELLKRFFTKSMDIKDLNQDKKYGCEMLKCDLCSYKTLTIIDTPRHLENHLKKKVVLTKH